MAPPPKTFISYSHDSEAHRVLALDLAKKLREEGVDCEIDQFILGSPIQGWPRWMRSQIQESTFVLVVCTETYQKGLEGRSEHPRRGKGADWEGMLIMQELYEKKSLNEKFIPIVFGDDDKQHIPLLLQPYTHYSLFRDYDLLYRHLTHQHGTPRPPLGNRRDLLPTNP